MPRQSKDTVATLGIDIGKNTFHLVGLNKRGAIVLRQKLSRRQLEARLANLPPCLIGMEACVGAHHLSRRLKAFGHDAKLMPAKYVKAFLKGNKNDYRDAEAIAEAVQRPTMRFVATKTAEQLDLQALHRVRSRLVSERTAIANEIRAFLLDRGIAVAQGLHRLRLALPDILATRTDLLAPRLLHILNDLIGDWRRLDERIHAVSLEIQLLAQDDPACERLMTVPGIGPTSPAPQLPPSEPVMPSPRAATSVPGLASCLSKSPPAIAPSSARFPNEVIVTCARCSSRLPASCSSGPLLGSAMASSPGSRRRRSGCTTTSWRSRSPTSSRASPGASSIMAATSR